MASSLFQNTMASMLGYLTVLVQISSVCSVLSGSPSDVTVKVGQNAYFQCIASLSDTLAWKRYEPSKILYNGNPNTIPDTSKYNVVNNNGNYNLTIFGTSTNDGAPYSCMTVPSMSDEALADLLVVDTPFFSPFPPTPQSAGSILNITCYVNYGGATTFDTNRPLSPSQDLQMTISIGSGSDTTYTSSSPGPGYVFLDFKTTSNATLQSPRRKLFSINRTLSVSDAGKSVSCTVSSTTPYYHDSAPQMVVPMSAPPTNLQFSSNSNSSSCSSGNGNCQMGDSINCTATGYPTPSVGWKLISPSSCQSMGQQGSGYAMLQVMCSGTNTWNCTASNNQGQASRSITFNVAGSIPGKDTGEGFAFQANWLHCLIPLLAVLCGMHFGWMPL